jgi:hypothetical protein
MKDKKTIKRELLDQFREIDAESGDELDPKWLQNVYFKQLRRPEQKLYQKAVAELSEMGIIRKETRAGLNLRLTLKGEKLLASGASRLSGQNSSPDVPLFRFTGTDG